MSPRGFFNFVPKFAKMSILHSSSDLTIEYPPEQTFHEYFLRRCREFTRDGRTKSLYDIGNDKVYNFDDYEVLSGAAAKSFWKKGLRRGDIVIFTSSDVGLVYSLLLGVWRANGAARICYSDESPGFVIEKIRLTNSHWIICDFEMAEGLLKANIPEHVEIFVFGDRVPPTCFSVQDLIKDDPEIEIPKTESEIDDGALILQTSGTTGQSKGCVHTHKDMIHSARVFETQPMTEDLTKPFLFFGRTTHASGSHFCFGILSTGQYIIRSIFTEKLLFELVSNLRIENLSIVMVFKLLDYPHAKDYDMTSLRHINCGGYIITPEFYSSMKAAYPHLKTIAVCYGMTEISQITSTCIPNRDRKRIIYEDLPPGSTGKLAPGYNLKIRNSETGEILGPNEPGEILIQSDSVFKEYYKDPEQTEKAILPGHWYITGDYGYYDENGFIFILDRVKDIFCAPSGNHISPTELESVILEHRAIRECAVIPEPFGQEGEPRAFIVLKSGFSPSPELEEEVKQFANAKLAPYKHLHGGVFIIESLPRGPTGKIVRRMLADFKR